MNHVTAQTQILGQFRRFGPAGPVYEVVSLGRIDESGERWLKVRLVENGEDADYKLDDALQDPFEA